MPQIDPRMVQWDAAPAADTPPAIDPRMVKWDDAPAPSTASSLSSSFGSSLRSLAPVLSSVLDNPSGAIQAATQVGAGALRGAARIGTTLLTPVDAAARALGISNSFIGRNDRGSQIDQFMQDNSNPQGLGYKAGDIGAQIAGTAGVGGAASKTLGAIPGVARTAGPLLDAIGSSGFTAGGLTGAPGVLTRATGGAITGGLSAGILNPSDAGMGALIGGAMAPAVQGIGKLGGYLGDRAAQAAADQAAELSRKAPFYDTLKNSIGAGYVVPPSSVNPSLTNTIKESISGKIATAQTASSKNQAVTDGLVRNALGMSADTPLSAEVLSKYRADTHAAGYEPLRQLGTIPAGNDFSTALDNIANQYTGKGTIPAIQKTDITDLVNAHRSTGFDAGDAVDAIRVLREDANDAFRQGNSAMGKANKGIADAYEGAIGSAIPANQSDLLTAYQNARANIAKSFTVENALREGAGTVDARKLAAELQKGSPLSGDLLTAANFANVFPKAAQPPNLVAGPGVHNLTAGLAAGSAMVGSHFGPVGAAAGAVYPFLIPPAIRMQMFSKAGQNALLPAVQSAGPGLSGLLAGTQPAQSLLRAAPVLPTSLLSGSGP